MLQHELRPLLTDFHKNVRQTIEAANIPPDALVQPAPHDCSDLSRRCSSFVLLHNLQGTFAEDPVEQVTLSLQEDEPLEASRQVRASRLRIYSHLPDEEQSLDDFVITTQQEEHFVRITPIPRRGIDLARDYHQRTLHLNVRNGTGLVGLITKIQDVRAVALTKAQDHPLLLDGIAPAETDISYESRQEIASWLNLTLRGIRAAFTDSDNAMEKVRRR